MNAIAKEHGIKQKILLRIAPGIDPHTHKAIMTGSVDSKFGKAIATGQAYEITQSALTMNNIELCGFHCHIGSQIFECQPFCDAADNMLRFVAEVKKRFGYEASVLNLGGGFGVRYVESHPEINIADNIKTVNCHSLSVGLYTDILCPHLHTTECSFCSGFDTISPSPAQQGQRLRSVGWSLSRDAWFVCFSIVLFFPFITKIFDI